MLSKNLKKTILRKKQFHLLIRNTTIRLLKELSVPLFPILSLSKRMFFIWWCGSASYSGRLCLPKDIDNFVPSFHKDARSINWPHVTKMFEKNGLRLNVPPPTKASGGIRCWSSRIKAILWLRMQDSIITSEPYLPHPPLIYMSMKMSMVLDLYCLIYNLY